MQLVFQAYELRIAQHINQYSITDLSAHVALYVGGRGVLGHGSGGPRGGSSKSPSLKYVVCQLCGKVGMSL